MLNINTRIVDSSDMLLAKSAKILGEGQALVYVPGEVGLAPAKGETGEVFAWLCYASYICRSGC